MNVKGKNYRTIWMKDQSVFMIEQNLLPFEFEIFEAKSYKDTCFGISTMIVRGAGAIGAAAAFAMAQAFLEAPGDGFLEFIIKAKKKSKIPDRLPVIFFMLLIGFLKQEKYLSKML